MRNIKSSIKRSIAILALALVLLASSSWAMYPTSGMWRIVKNLTVPTNTVSVSWTTNIDGDRNEIYRLNYMLLGTAAIYSLTLNNDTGSNYTKQLMFANNDTLAVSIGTSLSAMSIGAATNSVGELTIYAKSGVARVLHGSMYNNLGGTVGTVSGVQHFTWTNTADNLIRIDIVASTNTILAGSRLILSKLAK